MFFRAILSDVVEEKENIMWMSLIAVVVLVLVTLIVWIYVMSRRVKHSKRALEDETEPCYTSYEAMSGK